jgi:hypothetical protein
MTMGACLDYPRATPQPALAMLHSGDVVVKRPGMAAPIPDRSIPLCLFAPSDEALGRVVAATSMQWPRLLPRLSVVLDGWEAAPQFNGSG